jgi:hypothetical protein
MKKLKARDGIAICIYSWLGKFGWYIEKKKLQTIQLARQRQVWLVFRRTSWPVKLEGPVREKEGKKKARRAIHRPRLDS